MSEFQSRLQEVLGSHYRVERELGGGGMSRVFVAEEVDLARKVVVKVLPPDTAADLNADRFKREIQLAASLQHPHIVPLIASGRSGDVVWYTMPFIEGESLRAKLARERELPVSDAVRILREVTDALSYAHDHGVVHRDIKPDNVLITGRHAVVTDFGVAKAVSASTGGESSLTSIGVALGTPAYMSPEQASADPHVDHRADIYSVGAMAYEMLSGTTPFSGPPQLVLAAHVTQAPEPVSQRRPSIPPALATLIMRALEKKPADRWQSASEVHQQLELMATPSGGAQPTSATVATAGRPVGRRPLWIGAGVAATAAIVAASWQALKPASGVDEVTLDPHVVAVLPFRVAGADPSLHYLRQGMVDLLQAKLTGAGGPRAADARSVIVAFRDAGGTDETDVGSDGVAGIARKVGAARVVQGSIVGPPDHIVLSASLLEVPGGRSLAQTSVEGPKDSLFVLVDRLTAQLLALGGGATEQQLTSLTTTSLEALRAYLDGVAALRRAAFTSSTMHLTRAVQLDSTFALALSALIESNGWKPASIDMSRVARLAWQYRDRLSSNDRLMLSIRLGSRFPLPTPATEQIADRERAVQSMPDNPDAWYFLGDRLFHDGRLADLPNSLIRAKDAFTRAFQLDTLFGGAITHLFNLALVEGDTSAARLWLNRQQALDSTDVRNLKLVFAGASLRGDADGLRALWPKVDSSSLTAADLLMNFPFDTAVIRNADRLRAAVVRGATSLIEKQLAIQTVVGVLWNEGRLREAEKWMDSYADQGAPADQVAANQTMRRVLFSGDWGSNVSFAPVLNESPFGLFSMEVTKLARGDTSSVTRSLASMQRMATAANDDDARRMLLVLDAFSAVVKRQSNSEVALQRADSAVRGWAFRHEPFSILQGWGWYEVGRYDRALLAIRRRVAVLGFPFFVGLAEALRLEGKIAAKAGDMPGAILAYERYLRLRHDPEPVKKPQRDSVVAELAALKR